jgi:hypothetical protein
VTWGERLAKLKVILTAPRAIFGAFGGRHYILCVFFALTAAYFEWKHELEPSYAAAITAIAGVAGWRAVSEDRKEEKCGQCDDGPDDDKSDDDRDARNDDQDRLRGLSERARSENDREERDGNDCKT